MTTTPDQPAQSPLVDANGYYRGTSAADRVRAFLDARSKSSGLDPELLASYGRKDTIFELTASDLRAVLEKLEQLDRVDEVLLTLPESARLSVRQAMDPI